MHRNDPGASPLLTSPENQLSDDSPSMTALVNITTFLRTLKTGYAKWFSEDETVLIEHLVKTALSSHRRRYWPLKVLGMIPYYCQTQFWSAMAGVGYDAVIMSRKFMIRQHIKESISKGVTQVVILGGGYDSCAYISARYYPSVKFYELDRGRTRDLKLKGLIDYSSSDSLTISAGLVNNNATITFNGNLHYINCNLSKDNLCEILQINGFSKNNKTLIVAEGLTMYLKLDELEKLLEAIQHLTNIDDELIISFMTKQDDVSREEKLVNASNETYHFSLGQNEVTSFLAKFDLDTVGKTDHVTRMLFAGDLVNAKFHKDNPDRPKEIYYLGKRSLMKTGIHKDIKDVPQIEFVPPYDKDTYQTCQIL